MPQIEIATIINSLISLTALSVAIYSLYLQRRDRKPRLTVEPELGVKQIKLADDGFSGHTLVDDYCLVITLRNSTEKDIEVSNLNFVTKNNNTLELEPWNKRLPVVLSHKASEVIIPREQLVRAFGAKLKGKGYIRIKDVLGNISSSSNKHYDLTDLRNYFVSDSDYHKWSKQKLKEKEE
ncbi:MAG: hypothetical protein AABN95_00290 [Acidobacteriota bacterium]